MIQSSRLAAAASDHVRMSDPTSPRSNRKDDYWPMTDLRAARGTPARADACQSTATKFLQTARGLASERVPLQ